MEIVSTSPTIAFTAASEVFVIGGVILVAGSVFIGLLLIRILASSRKRRALEVQPFPEEWREICRRSVPLYKELPNDLREPLERLVIRFLGTKQFEACGELEEVTDEIRLTVATTACLLLIGSPNTKLPFPSLRSVLIYPDAYQRRGRDGEPVLEPEYSIEGEGDLTFDQQGGALLGESWNSGSVILSWEVMRQDRDQGKDGFNLVLHEFAHQLDQEYSVAAGLPLLDSKAQYKSWADAFQEGFERHRERAATGWDTIIDPYGAQDPAEFFACSTEVFFELPEDLRRDVPDVFEELVTYYRIDPRDWTRG